MQNPFYGLILMGLPIEETDKVETAGVSLNRDQLSFTLSVNPKFWNSLKDVQQVEVFKHELLHICFYHCLLGKSFRNWNLFNIAADEEVNQYLDRNSLPEGCVDLVKQFPGLARKAGAKFYYEFLSKDASSSKGKGGSEDTSGQKGNSSGKEGQQTPYGKILDDHSAWKEIENMSEAEKELITESLNKTLVEAWQGAKGRGTVPGSIEEYIKNLLDRKPVFNWKAYFRRLVGNAEEVFVKSSRKKESKRFEGGAGIRKIHCSKILVGIDTSGSVSSKELAEFFTELKHIAKAKCVNVDIAEFDSDIQKVFTMNPNRLDTKVVGRGGTDFQPIVDMYNANRKKYSALVIFTDGEAPVPKNVSGQCIWVITQNCHPDFPGKIVDMKGNI